MNTARAPQALPPFQDGDTNPRQREMPPAQEG
jgi:hypothetical protein